MIMTDETLQRDMLHLYGNINTYSCGTNGINLHNLTP